MRLQVRFRRVRSWWSANASPASSISFTTVFLLVPVMREMARIDTPSTIMPTI